jgi:hypothetical protein
MRGLVNNWTWSISEVSKPGTIAWTCACLLASLSATVRTERFKTNFSLIGTRLLNGFHLIANRACELFQG